MSEADQILQELDKRVVTQVRRARFVGVTPEGMGLVDMGGSRFPATFTGYVPEVDEPVQVLSVGPTHLILAGRALPGTGTVMTVTGGWVTVQTDVGEYRMPHLGEAPGVGTLVGINWSHQAHVTGVLSLSPDPVEPPPDPGSGGLQSATFQPTDTGSTDRSSARWWTARPHASTSTYGAWFYGTQIRGTIPSGATLEKLEFFVAWQQRRGAVPRFALHNLSSKSGLPSMGSHVEWDPGSGWQTPPMAQAWFDGLKAGGSYLGVGLNQGGYNIFSSRADNSMSGALRVSWRV